MALEEAAKGKDLDTLTSLVKLDSFDPTSDDAIHALLSASESGLDKMVELLLAHRVSPSATNQWRDTPLLLASDGGHFEVVKALVDAGAAVDAKNQWGDTALMVSSISGHEEVVGYLLNSGAEIEVKSSTGDTPLLRAAERGHAKVCGVLIEKGANVDVKNSILWTPLLAATENGHLEVVKLLAQKGADLEVSGQAGTAVDVARAEEFEDILEFLVEFQEKKEEEERKRREEMLAAAMARAQAAGPGGPGGPGGMGGPRRRRRRSAGSQGHASVGSASEVPVVPGTPVGPRHFEEFESPVSALGKRSRDKVPDVAEPPKRSWEPEAVPSARTEERSGTMVTASGVEPELSSSVAKPKVESASSRVDERSASTPAPASGEEASAHAAVHSSDGASGAATAQEGTSPSPQVIVVPVKRPWWQRMCGCFKKNKRDTAAVSPGTSGVINVKPKQPPTAASRATMAATVSTAGKSQAHGASMVESMAGSTTGRIPPERSPAVAAVLDREKRDASFRSTVSETHLIGDRQLAALGAEIIFSDEDTDDDY